VLVSEEKGMLESACLRESGSAQTQTQKQDKINDNEPTRSKFDGTEEVHVFSNNPY
jgi:hypothetical protein